MSGNGASKISALYVAAAEMIDHRNLIFILHPFGGCGHAHTVCHSHDCADYSDAFRYILRCNLNETAVDLDRTEPRFAYIAQGRIHGPDIVKLQFDAQKIGNTSCRERVCKAV